jgi:hypothetical protein
LIMTMGESSVGCGVPSSGVWGLEGLSSIQRIGRGRSVGPVPSVRAYEYHEICSLKMVDVDSCLPMPFVDLVVKTWQW